MPDTPFNKILSDNTLYLLDELRAEKQKLLESGKTLFESDNYSKIMSLNKLINDTVAVNAKIYKDFVELNEKNKFKKPGISDLSDDVLALDDK